MQNITATHINYHHVCNRKLWLFSHGIQMEHTSELVHEGKLIGENTYSQRSERYTEVAFSIALGEGREGAVKIDFYDAKEKVVHEIKKSNRIDSAHRAQVKFYLYVLERNGVEGVRGVLEYPKLRHTEGVELGAEDRGLIESWVEDIFRIVENEVCPKVIDKPVCKNCAYCEFCYAGE